MNRLNISMLGDSFSDTRFALALSAEKDAEKMMHCVFADGRAACRINLCFRPDVNTDENHIYVENIELTSANRTQAERIMSELIDDEQRISDMLTQLDSEHYCKLAEINASVESDKLKVFLFNDEFFSNINEITICFNIRETLLNEISEKGFDSISFRSVYDLVYYTHGATSISTEILSHLHYAMQKTDVFIIADSPFYNTFTDEQIELLKPYIKSIPVVAYNSESDLLIDILEDIDDYDEIRKEYLENAKKIKCRNTNRMLKKAGVGNAFCDEEYNIMTIGCTSGDDGHNMELYNNLLAFSLGLVAEKFSSWITHCPKPEIHFNEELINKITELADTEEQIAEFLKSDKPLIHPNGGITIKNHGKYKFRESCILASGLYRYLDAVIDDSNIGESEKYHLHNKLLHILDSYAFYNGNKLMNREKFVEAAEYARKSNAENAIYELAQYIMNYLK